MKASLPPSLSRLADINPSPVDEQLGHSPLAQATLERILAEGAAPRRRRRRRRLGAPLPLIAMVVAGLAGGGAVAATDPFHWWKSVNPDTAMYVANPNAHVPTATIGAVNCAPAGGGVYLCGARSKGRPYTNLGPVAEPNSPSLFTRASMISHLNRALARHAISASAARRLTLDVDALPDSFFAELQSMSGYASVGSGVFEGRGARVPPPGVPAYLACQLAGAQLRCRDLNGDQSVPVGTAIYSAEPTRDWRPAPPQRSDPANAAFLRSLTPAELRFLRDTVTLATPETQTSATHPSVRVSQKASPAKSR